MLKIIFLLAVVIVTFSSTGHAIRGVYIGASGGQVAFNAGSENVPSIGYGITGGIKHSKVVDFLLSGLTSQHGGLRHFAANGSAEFHPMLLDSLEVTMGLGAGMHILSTSSTSEVRPDINFGAAVDLILGKAYRLGFVGRAHFLNEGALGGNLKTIMVRFGYVFDLTNS